MGQFWELGQDGEDGVCVANRRPWSRAGMMGRLWRPFATLQAIAVPEGCNEITDHSSISTENREEIESWLSVQRP